MVIYVDSKVRLDPGKEGFCVGLKKGNDLFILLWLQCKVDDKNYEMVKRLLPPACLSILCTSLVSFGTLPMINNETKVSSVEIINFLEYFSIYRLNISAVPSPLDSSWTIGSTKVFKDTFTRISGFFCSKNDFEFISTNLKTKKTNQKDLSRAIIAKGDGTRYQSLFLQEDVSFSDAILLLNPDKELYCSEVPFPLRIQSDEDLAFIESSLCISRRIMKFGEFHDWEHQIPVFVPQRFFKNRFESKVVGFYQYYHYGHQNFNDKGWGCAYRVCQIMISWLIHQNFLAHQNVPSIPEIQKILVELGDKSNSFLSSKGWIGSYEVSLIIDRIANISCKIIHLQSSASDKTELMEEMAKHFSSSHSPVFIGVDQYAYCIIGFDRKAESFLVLDPHFDGPDDPPNPLKWMSMKKIKDFTKKESFYNFCFMQAKLNK